MFKDFKELKKESEQKQYSSVFSFIFDNAYSIAYNDREMAHDIMQEMSCVLCDILEGQRSGLVEKMKHYSNERKDVEKAFCDNMIEYHTDEDEDNNED